MTVGDELLQRAAAEKFRQALRRVAELEELAKNANLVNGGKLRSLYAKAAHDQECWDLVELLKTLRSATYRAMRRRAS